MAARLPLDHAHERGACPWPVSGRVRRDLVHERALIEAGIGTLKSSRYGFNRPAARSFERMGACGQRAVLGFNLKLVRGLAARSGQVLVGGVPATSTATLHGDGDGDGNGNGNGNGRMARQALV